MPLLLHGSCAALADRGVLFTGPSGSGKSDLVLRLLDRGFALVADDQVRIEDGFAGPPAPLAGLLEVRGLGILRLPFVASVRLILVVRLGCPGERLPHPARMPALDLPMVSIDATAASAAQRVVLALDAASGRIRLDVGAFA